MPDRIHGAHRAPVSVHPLEPDTRVPCARARFHPGTCAGTAAFRLEFQPETQFLCAPCLASAAAEKGFAIPTTAG